ncbi:MAG: hypothetical protein R3227_08885, partial [Reinekea sp.]|nr:hypothetical protein [Reinekea sp.]
LKSRKRSPNGLRFDFNDFTSGEGRIKGISPWKENLQEIHWLRPEPLSSAGLVLNDNKDTTNKADWRCSRNKK